MIKCVIIDDEPLALSLLRSYAEKVEILDVRGAFTNPIEGLSFIQNNSIDLLFLDIQMPELSGTDVAKIVQDKCKVIFTTAYAEYAVQGFELKAVDYLVKPITLERFLDAVNRIQKDEESGDENRTYIFVKTEYRHQKINYDDIQFFKGMGDYVQIVLAEEKIMTLEKMKYFEQELPNSFIRVHKSYIVSIDKIEFVEKNRIRIKEEIIPIGAKYQEGFWKVVSPKG